jgi:hypothetical protein
VIAELAIGTLLLGGAVSGWVAAYRARGQANESAERARLSEAKAEAQERAADLARMNESAARGELHVAEVNLSVARRTIAMQIKERNDEYERLAKAGVPVGDVLVGGAIGVLYPHEDGDADGREAGPGGGGEVGGPLSDDPTGPASRASER